MVYYQNIIVGCGPAGLQCAYYFEKHNIDYVIIERNSEAASFFSNYPLSGKLISINKRFTGNDNKDFNLRHDWNSLLTDDEFSFKDYSDTYYPKRESLVEYMNDFAKRYNIKILFNKNVKKINKVDRIFSLKVNDSEEFSCENLIMASGLSKMSFPNFELNVSDKIKHYGEYSKDYFLNYENLKEFENKSVLIIGGGNASFELANILNEATSSITILGKTYRKMAMQTNYSGDIRSVYLQYMDTFLLKSMNAINSFNGDSETDNLLSTTKIGANEPGLRIVIEQQQSNDPYYISAVNVFEDKIFVVSVISNSRPSFDKIIFCTGWKFDDTVFDFNVNLTINGKYPKIKSNFESDNVENLFFIGSLMHSVDFRVSSGGFIHGFRYLIKNFVQSKYRVGEQIFTHMSFSTEDDIHKLCDHVVSRINTSSAIYQMFGHLGDLLVYNRSIKNIIYNKDVPVNVKNGFGYVNNTLLFPDTIYFTISLEYGKKIERFDQAGRKLSDIGQEGNSALIHPVVRVFNNAHNLMDVVYFDENLYMEFTHRGLYYERFFRLFKSYMV